MSGSRLRLFLTSCIFVGVVIVLIIGSPVAAAAAAAAPAPAAAAASGPYQPNWASLDARPLPAWYDDAKVGVFLHWGVFSVPSFGDEWFWFRWGNGDNKSVEFMKENYRPGFTYAEFAPMFRAGMFRPNDWADLFEKSGAKYVVLTSKHHEGYTNWPSSRSFNWNSMDVGPKRDLVGDLAAAVREKKGIKFGLYHSWFEWFHPLYLQDKHNNWQTNDFVTSKTYPELIEIVTKYKPELIWSDGDWEAPSWYWNSTRFLAWLYNDSPVKDTVVVNDRWGMGTFCKHGGYWNCEDRFQPSKPLNHKWENAFTVDKSSWGYSRLTPLSGYLTPEELVHKIVETVSLGGNALVNVGPTADGRLLPIFQERLLQMGRWLGINGEAIYATKFCQTFQNDSLTKDVFYTCAKNVPSVSYAIFFRLPVDKKLVLGSVAQCPTTPPVMLGAPGKIGCRRVEGRGIELDLSGVVDVVEANSLKWAWSVKMKK